ncbi:hypothetical protein DFR46_0068 [Parasphingopyxis lamellibrachiae]|uniref:Uncharacterized protein n=1 Tax=Parasphingopyxis lamellibrachiae TaxID=680125 RepID=A0A3D9FBI6_9SPHN|nr:hypothetical protein DFR46_0068 [Parasphingopyxis lamellibrachiae]
MSPGLFTTPFVISDRHTVNDKRRIWSMGNDGSSKFLTVRQMVNRLETIELPVFRHLLKTGTTAAWYRVFHTHIPP